MNERFERLFQLEGNLYSDSSPVILSAGVLLKDLQTGNVIVQLKFQSVSLIPIKALKVEIAALDISGAEVGDAVEYQYLDLNIPNGACFGANKAIVMPHTTTRSFIIKSICVFLVNGLSKEVSKPLKALPEAIALSEILDEEELIKQYKIVTNAEAKYKPDKCANLWRCACGIWNSEDFCTHCHIAKAQVFSAFDYDSLAENMKIRLAAEEKQKQAEAEMFKQKRKQQEVVKAKTLKRLKIITPVAIVTIALFMFVIKWFIPNVIYGPKAYKEAVNLFNDGKYLYAAQAFEQLGDYSDSAQYAVDAWYKGNLHKSIASGYQHTLGLKTDGTVVATGSNRSGKCEVSAWTDIVSVAAGASHSVGLKADGTVVAAGSNEYGECAVDTWTNIISIAACERKTFGLKADGTLCFTGEFHDYEIKDLQGMKNLVAIFASSSSFYAITDSGTVINRWGFELWDGMDGFVDFAASSSAYNYAGVQSDGSVISGGDYAVKTANMNQIIRTACGYHFTLGLRNDGKIMYAGSEDVEALIGECKQWNDIVLIDSSGVSDYVVALRTDGTVMATGENNCGQCDVSNWRDIVVPRLLDSQKPSNP